MLLLFSEINKINKNFSIFVSIEPGRKSVRNLTMEMEILAEYALVFTPMRLGGEIDLHPVELFTFRNSEYRHKHDFYMPPTLQIKLTKTASTHDWERIWN